MYTAEGKHFIAIALGPASYVVLRFQCCITDSLPYRQPLGIRKSELGHTLLLLVQNVVLCNLLQVFETSAENQIHHFTEIFTI